jgi:hypothetical protein
LTPSALVLAEAERRLLARCRRAATAPEGPPRDEREALARQAAAR